MTRTHIPQTPEREGRILNHQERVEREMNAVSIRASRLPLLALCPASAAPGPVSESAEDGAARMGTAVHAIVTGWIVNGLAADDIDAQAARLGVDPEELGKNARITFAAWSRAAENFPGAQVEVPLVYEANGLRLTGHADIVSPPSANDGTEARVLDLKTGWLDVDHSEQLAGYAFLLAKHYTEVDRIYAAVLRRDFTLDGRYWTRAELGAWYSGLLERLKSATYRPGFHCWNCPRRLNCDAADSFIRRNVLALVVVDAAGEPLVSSELDGPALAEALDRAKLLEHLCADVREAVRIRVAEAGGVIQTGDGRQLELTRTERRTIVFPAALPVLRAALGDDLDRLLEVSKTRVEAAYKATIRRGAKGEAVAELIRRLDEAGAIQVKAVERLECRRAAEPISVLQSD